jgi:ABC-type dipeptide/oligopeptide/nickel transport system permease subunit
VNETDTKTETHPPADAPAIRDDEPLAGGRFLAWIFGFTRLRRPAAAAALQPRRPNLLVLLTGGVLLGSILLAFVGTYFLKDPNQQNLIESFAHPSLHGPVFGTDELGRDFFSRVVAGAKTTLMIAFIADVLVLAIGVSVGTVAALAGGLVEETIMRFVDLVYSLPGLLMTLVIVFVLGPSARSVVIALVADGWLVFARLAHGLTKTLKRSAFVEFARISRSSRWQVVRRHVLPHLASPVLTVATLELARLALAESTLSFLGLGVQPPAVSLGMLLEDGENNMAVAWWLITLPGLYLVLIILSANVLASWVRIASDPLQAGLIDV